MALPSYAKVIANGQNAQKSTGPRTPEGKSIVAKNSMRHGLRAAEILMDIDFAEDADEFAQTMIADLRPVGANERQLVALITAQMWQARRITAVETGLINNHLSADAGLNLAAAFEQADKIAVFQRYSTAIQRAMHRNLALLEKVQKERREQAPFIEAVSDMYLERTRKSAKQANRAAETDLTQDVWMNNLRLMAEDHLRSRGHDIPEPEFLPPTPEEAERIRKLKLKLRMPVDPIPEPEKSGKPELRTSDPQGADIPSHVTDNATEPGEPNGFLAPEQSVPAQPSPEEQPSAEVHRPSSTAPYTVEQLHRTDRQCPYSPLVNDLPSRQNLERPTVIPHDPRPNAQPSGPIHPFRTMTLSQRCTLNRSPKNFRANPV